MTNVAVYNVDGKEISQMELNDAVFNRPINEGLMHQAVVLYLASLRHGTHAVKSRGMVSGGGKKPWRQKGTGHARVGSSRNPVWRGGGVAFGPTPRSHSIAMPRKQRRIALASALSDKFQNGNLIVLDDIDFAAPKTKDMIAVLAKFEADNAMIVFAGNKENVVKSARNIVGIMPVSSEGVNTYHVLNHKKVIITKDAVARLEEVLANA
ncbi:MAG: 50S ribosomal protein L4 [Clostridia bacterium]|jgi:large subunit ribosomal protein L4|nr:50S ribosomal protein L4 [Clostridia bacterium]MDD4572449.1 50S ribosomal protein L4 [Clostridia bacterium]